MFRRGDGRRRYGAGEGRQGALRFIKPATPIRAASALPSSFTRANSRACAGHRRIASLRAASLAPSFPGGMPTKRFHVGGVRKTTGRPRAAITPSMTATASTEGECAYSAFLGPRADEFDKGLGRVDLATVSASKAALTLRRPAGPSARTGMSKTSSRAPALVRTAIAPGNADVDAERELFARGRTTQVVGFRLRFGGGCAIARVQVF